MRTKEEWMYTLKRSIPALVVLVLQIGLIIFLLSIGHSVVEGMQYGLGYSIRQVITIDVNGGTDKQKESDINTLSHIEGVTEVFEGECYYMRTPMLFFNTGGTPFIKVQEGQLEALMERLDVKLIEGDLPKDEDQILVTAESLALYDAQIGDWIGRDYIDEDLDKNYQICGVIKGKANIYLSEMSGPTKGYVVTFAFPYGDVVETEVLRLFKQVASIGCYSETRLFEKTLIHNMLILGGVVVTVFFAGLVATILNLLSNELKGRLSEITLLRLIGYSYGKIKRQLFSYYAILLSIGGLIGVGVGEIGVILFKYLYCEARGIYFNAWHNTFIVVPAIMILILYGLTIRCMNLELKQNSWQKSMYE